MNTRSNNTPHSYSGIMIGKTMVVVTVVIPVPFVNVNVVTTEVKPLEQARFT